MSEISSGLVAVVATDHPDLVGGIVWSRIELEWINKRLSDAEAIIAQKDAEILEQCRINGMGAERELALLGQIERQSSSASGLEVTDGIALAFHRALTDGSIGQSEVDEIKTGLRAALAAAPTPPVSEDRKDAERYRALKIGDFAVNQFVSASYGWKFIPTEELDAAIDQAMQEDKQ